LSLPVRDLKEAKRFYTHVLGCSLGRERDGWFDVDFYGCQLTLHERPDEVLGPDQRGVRHFGVTLPEDQWKALVARVRAHGVDFVRGPSTEGAGTAREQSKALIEDPSGNAIELKTYRDPGAALAP
jgi:hypothetical protein